MSPASSRLHSLRIIICLQLKEVEKKFVLNAMRINSKNRKARNWKRAEYENENNSDAEPVVMLIHMLRNILWKWKSSGALVKRGFV